MYRAPFGWCFWLTYSWKELPEGVENFVGVYKLDGMMDIYIISMENDWLLLDSWKLLQISFFIIYENLWLSFGRIIISRSSLEIITFVRKTISRCTLKWLVCVRKITSRCPLENDSSVSAKSSPGLLVTIPLYSFQLYDASQWSTTADFHWLLEELSLVPLHN